MRWSAVRSGIAIAPKSAEFGNPGDLESSELVAFRDLGAGVTIEGALDEAEPGAAGEALTGPPPEEGGRRSRRGFAYQDAVAVLDCLDMLDGAYDSVGFEMHDDLDCEREGDFNFRQVKTHEGPDRYSIAMITRPKRPGQLDTCLLGKLFLGKDVTEGTRFTLVLNETPSDGLFSFVVMRGGPPSTPPKRHRDAMAQRLSELSLPAGRSIDWYVERFDVLVEARTIEQVEAMMMPRLRAHVARILGQEPLLSELEDVAARLAARVSRDSTVVKPRRWTPDSFQGDLDRAVLLACGRSSGGAIRPLERLVDKLGAAGVPLDQAQVHSDRVLRHQRGYRSAGSQERRRWDAASDHVFAVCAESQALRRAGEIEAGAVAYAKTLEGVQQLHEHNPVLGSASELTTILDEITSRCVNRYLDDA